ncbi:protein CUSTOS [Gastrophryne carolinensis]
MAAPNSRTQPKDSDSSSSDDELRERLKEAAWLPPAVEKSAQRQQDPVAPVISSLRTQPDNHEHDGNELQTTPEFRAYVAKKLSAMLDSCIKEIPGGSSVKVPEAEPEEEDEGFRLFSSSIPGDTGATQSNLPPKRRPAYSSSSDDSEEEFQRCREAAVSGLDILKYSALTPVPVETSQTPTCDQITKKCKKKKKKKMKRDFAEATESEPQEISIDSVSNGFKKGKKSGDETAPDHQDFLQEQKPNNLNKKKKKHKPIGDNAELRQEVTQELELCGTKKKRKKHRYLDGDTV